MVKVKVCGLTNAGDALFALQSGADYAGFIVDVPVETPRKITLKQAAEMLQEVERKQVVFVLMPSTLKQVEAALELKPFAIQFHGHETPEFIAAVKGISSKTRLIKAIHVKKNSTFEETNKAMESHTSQADYLLLDTETEKLGGTGETHDWRLAAKLVESTDTPVFLSGGLNPGNAREAILKVNPHGLDASSGLESTPGVKDHTKIGLFLEEAGKCST